jgi:hypothetical protein
VSWVIVIKPSFPVLPLQPDFMRIRRRTILVAIQARRNSVGERGHPAAAVAHAFVRSDLLVLQLLSVFRVHRLGAATHRFCGMLCHLVISPRNGLVPGTPTVCRRASTYRGRWGFQHFEPRVSCHDWISAGSILVAECAGSAARVCTFVRTTAQTVTIEMDQVFILGNSNRRNTLSCKKALLIVKGIRHSVAPPYDVDVKVNAH